MLVERIAAFTADGRGGNPAGVVIAKAMPDATAMQLVAREVGYSETVFAVPQTGGGWRVRYFSPEAEVAFCGHATIALGVALSDRLGMGRYPLVLNHAEIAVEAGADGTVTLTSPPTGAEPLDPALRDQIMGLFGLSPADLDPRLPPTLGLSGNRHPILTLKDRAQLSAMSYPFAPVKALMEAEALTTISLIWIERNDLFHARNAFAIGGVVEDPATGSAAAALGGALTYRGWPGLEGGGRFTILQGSDMGAPSHLSVDISGRLGDPVRVSGRGSHIAQ